jgi:phage/plasmid-like protein (TIGR03299 family)
MHMVESLAFHGDVPWHGLGQRLDGSDLFCWESACKKAGLDWEAERVPLVTSDTQNKVPGHYAIRRKTDGAILGAVGKKYTILQNRDAFRWFQPFLEAGEAALEVAGSLKGGTRIFVLARLTREPLVVGTGDEVLRFVLLSHSHDGSLAVRLGWTPIRVCCANLLALAHRSEASKLIRCKHTKDLRQNMNNIRDMMNLANQEFEATAEQYRLLARKSVNQADLKKYVRLVFKVKDDAEPSTRLKNLMDGVIRLFEVGRGNDLPSTRHSLWTAYNAVTEHLSYFRGRNADNRLSSLWFGDGANINRHALDIALEMAA